MILEERDTQNAQEKISKKSFSVLINDNILKVEKIVNR